MNRPPSGNGSGQHEVEVVPIAPDWILLWPKGLEPWPADLPVGLNEVLVKWYRSQERIRIRHTQGIVKDGQTVGIHVWFERLPGESAPPPGAGEVPPAG